MSPRQDTSLSSSDFTPSIPQTKVLELLVRLIGISGVHKRPEQGDCIVLDLLPASHVITPWGNAEPFCIRVDQAGHIEFISDREAGLDHRPDFIESMALQARDMRDRLKDELG